MKYLVWILAGIVGLLFACQSTPTEEQTVLVKDTISEGPAAQLAALRNQIQLNPQNYALFQQRSQLYYLLDSLPQAEADIETALQLFPKGPDLHYLQGFYAFVQNDTAKALAAFQLAAQLGCENPENYYQMGQIFFFQQNDEMALRLYQQAEELAPQEPIYIFAQGFLQEKRNDKQGALREYLRSLAVDSSFAKSHLQLHDLYLDGFDNEVAAISQIRELLQYQPSHPLANFYMGNYHMRRLLAMTDNSMTPAFQEEANDAVMNYSIAINKNPSFLQAHYNRGFVYFLAQNIDRAMDDFKAAEKIDPQHQPSLLMLGDIFYNYQDLETARDYYRRAIAADPGNPDIQAKLEELEALL